MARATWAPWGLSGTPGKTGRARGCNRCPTSNTSSAVVPFPNPSGALLTGQYYLYFSPDGNFVFGGSPYSADLLVGVRTGTGTPNLSGLYYEAGLDEDESTLNAGYASLDSFY